MRIFGLFFVYYAKIAKYEFLKREHRKVKADGTITLNKQLYEVPPRFIGQSIELRYDER
ncbi:Mu transposase C-terminal domain-containing protein, partial [Geobacillus jurassicus]